MKLIYFFSILTVMISCHSNNKNSGQNPEVILMDTVNDVPTGNEVDLVVIAKSNLLLWYAEDLPALKLYKPTVAGIDSMSTKNLIELINNNNDSIQIDYLKTSHDTIYVHIPHSKKLTEGVGSTGAEMYMASTTYSLTELKGIKYVNYDFVEGDHSSPSIYEHGYFRNFNKQ